jgi:hypothetical protein
MTTDTATDSRLDLEFAFTTWRNSCRDLFSPHQCCRRQRGHAGEHACGFGADRVRWAPDRTE